MKFSLFANEAVIGVDYVYTRFAYYIIICKVVCFQAEIKFYCNLHFFERNTMTAHSRQLVVI